MSFHSIFAVALLAKASSSDVCDGAGTCADEATLLQGLTMQKVQSHQPTLLHENEQCWHSNQCGGQGGLCPQFCGSGVCCRLGHTYSERERQECGVGGLGLPNMHSCQEALLVPTLPVDLATLHWEGGSFTIPAGQEGICLVRGPQTFPNDQVDSVSGLRGGCEVDLYQHGCPGGRVGTITGLTSDQGGLLGLEITALTVTCHPVEPPVGLATVHWGGGFFIIPEEEEGVCLSRGSATFPNDQITSITAMRDGCTVDFYQHGCPGGRVGTITHVTEPRSDLIDLEITALTLTCQSEPAPTHYLTVVSWPAHAWGQWNDDAKGAIEKCSARESTTDEDGNGYLFTSCCTAEGSGMRRVCGTTRQTNFETAVEQCAAQGGRLCTADEALSLDENNRGRRTTAGRGCSVDGPRRASGGDLNRLWTSTPCSP